MGLSFVQTENANQESHSPIGPFHLPYHKMKIITKMFVYICVLVKSNHCNFWGLMEESTPKTGGNLHHVRSDFGVDSSINPKYIAMILYHFILALLNADFGFDISVTNDVAKCLLLGKVMLHASHILAWKWAL